MNLDIASKVSGSDAVLCNGEGKVVICSDSLFGCKHVGLYVNQDYLNKVVQQGSDRATGLIKGLYEEERFLVALPLSGSEGQNLGIIIVSCPLAGVNAVLTKISNIFLTTAAVVVLVWGLRTGVQARADGVLLHGVLDLVAAVTAGLTALLISRLTRLLAPPGRGPREILVSIRPADELPAPA